MTIVFMCIHLNWDTCSYDVFLVSSHCIVLREMFTHTCFNTTIECYLISGKIAIVKCLCCCERADCHFMMRQWVDVVLFVCFCFCFCFARFSLLIISNYVRMPLFANQLQIMYRLRWEHLVRQINNWGRGEIVTAACMHMVKELVWVFLKDVNIQFLNTCCFKFVFWGLWSFDIHMYQ